MPSTKLHSFGTPLGFASSKPPLGNGMASPLHVATRPLHVHTPEYGSAAHAFWSARRNDPYPADQSAGAISSFSRAHISFTFSKRALRFASHERHLSRPQAICTPLRPLPAAVAATCSKSARSASCVKFRA